MKGIFRAVCFVMVLFIGNGALAGPISYDVRNRPIEFLGVALSGSSYNVSVEWDVSFNSAYGAGVGYVEPLFMGRRIEAFAAANALLQALIVAGYPGTSTVQNVVIP